VIAKRAFYVGSIVMARDGNWCPLDTRDHQPVFPLVVGCDNLPVDDDLQGDRWATFCIKVKGEPGAAWVLSPARFFGTTQSTRFEGSIQQCN
jgi:hypothetical protein